MVASHSAYPDRRGIKYARLTYTTTTAAFVSEIPHCYKQNTSNITNTIPSHFQQLRTFMTSGTSKTRKPAASTSTPSSSSTTSANGTSSRRKSETKKAATEPRPKRQTSSARKKKEADVVSDEADGDDADELLEKMSADSRKRRNR